MMPFYYITVSKLTVYEILAKNSRHGTNNPHPWLVNQVQIAHYPSHVLLMHVELRSLVEAC